MIIGISGKIGTGKTTLANMLLERLPGYERHAFADCLKEECSGFFDYPLEWNYSEDGKSQEVHLGSSVANPFGPAAIIPPYASMTVRRLLQWWGTDVCRKRDPNFWTKRMAERIQGKSKVIVDDMRFPSEAEMLRQEGGVLVRLEPYPEWTPGPNAGHESETALDDYAHFDRAFRPWHGGLSDVADKIVGRIVFGKAQAGGE